MIIHHQISLVCVPKSGEKLLKKYISAQTLQITCPFCELTNANTHAIR
jgi:hypothetical protein